MIKITFPRQSDKRVAAAIRSKGPQLVSTLTKTMDELMFALMKRIQEKLSGEVLQARGSALLRSVNKRPTVATGTTITGSVQAGGGAAGAYAQVQEEGGKRTYDIYPKNKLALAFFPGGSEGAGAGRIFGRRLYYKQGQRAGTLKPGTSSAFAGLGGIVVKHVVHPPLPQRSYMRSALNEMRAMMTSRIFRSAADALSG
jgi:hypothetical protein